MTTNLYDPDSGLLDLTTYRLPQDRGGGPRVTLMRPPIPRNSGGVNFDIYDYEMLFNDEETKRLIREGDTIGCFYIESPGMRSLLRRLSVETFEMLTAASSIIRPGVAESGMMKEFIERHKNPALRRYLVPEMEKYLSETYGVMIYQEDVLKIAHYVVGLTWEEADLLRRAMSGKMRSRDAMSQIEGRFFECAALKGIREEEAKELWRQISSFAGYAFCKAHSASFALLSFQVAYLKAHYPAEFLSSVLSNQGGYYSAAVYVQEAKRLGIKVLLPCVNESEHDYGGSNMVIRIGLMAVRNLSTESISRIVSERKANGKYVSLSDFIVRTRFAYEESAKLIKCGAMDCFGQTRPTLMRLLDVYIRHRRILEESYNDLFFNETFRIEKEVVTDVDYSIEEKCRIELETFDYMVSRHPLEFFGAWINRPDVITAAAMKKHNGRRVKMVGWYMTSKRIKTSKGDIMKFISLEDMTGTFEAVIFPKAYEKYAVDTLSMGPFILEGKVDIDGGNNLVVEKLEVLTAIELRSTIQKDSAEHNYYGDEEKFYDDEVSLVDKLGKEKLRLAYVS
ncbi:MAG: hypothetical protein AB9882_00885 [Ignavibacteriaceae bacterium]